MPKSHKGKLDLSDFPFVIWNPKAFLKEAGVIAKMNADNLFVFDFECPFGKEHVYSKNKLASLDCHNTKRFEFKCPDKACKDRRFEDLFVKLFPGKSVRFLYGFVPEDAKNLECLIELKLLGLAPDRVTKSSDTLVFMRTSDGQRFELSPNTNKRKNFEVINPDTRWLIKTFGVIRKTEDEDGRITAEYDFEDGVDPMFHKKAVSMGPISPSRYRLYGVWIDGDIYVFNVGRQLWVGKPDPKSGKLKWSKRAIGKFQSPESYEYIQGAPFPCSDRYEALSKTDLEPLGEVMKDLQFRGEIDRILFQGALFACMVPGVLDYRPYFQIIGSKGSGKSNIRNWILKPLFGPLGGHFPDGGTTDHGFREQLLFQAPVHLFWDEILSEKRERDELSKLHAVMYSLRNFSWRPSAIMGSSMEGISKGNGSGVTTYVLNVCPIFSSTQDIVTDSADEERYIRIFLKAGVNGVKRNKMNMKWGEHIKALKAMVTPDFVGGFLWRLLDNFPAFRANVQFLHDVGIEEFSSDIPPRYFDLYAPVLAGYHLWQSNKVVDLETAVDLWEKVLKRIRNGLKAEGVCDPGEALKKVLAGIIAVGNNQKPFPISEVIRRAAGGANSSAATKLQRACVDALHGIGLHVENGETLCIKLKNERLLSLCKKLGVPNPKVLRYHPSVGKKGKSATCTVNKKTWRVTKIRLEKVRRLWDKN